MYYRLVLILPHLESRRCFFKVPVLRVLYKDITIFLNHLKFPATIVFYNFLSGTFLMHN